MEVKKIINQLFCWPTDESGFRRKIKLAYDLMEMAKHDPSPTVIVDAIIDKLSNNKIYQLAETDYGFPIFHLLKIIVMYGDTQQAEKLLEMCFKDEIVNNQNRYSHALILGVSGALSRVGTIANVPRLEQLSEKIKEIKFGVVALGVRIAEEELKKLDQELISETIKVCQSRQS